jgi:predicted transcriptional regulator of viral defense system
LETALSYYGLIPEAVFTISSVSTLKTNSFKNKFGNFKYSNLKPNLFFGYQIIKINNYFFKIAEIEKTILDYLYLNSSIKSIDDLIELRLNKFILANEVNFPKIYEYATIYKSKSLIKKIKILKQFVND